MKNIQGKELDEVIKNFPLKPLFNKVVITLNNLDEGDKLILTNNILSDSQYIVAKGPMVNEIQVGDKVLIDVEKLMSSSYQDNGEKVSHIKVDPIQVLGHTFAFIEDRTIKAIDNRKEEIIKL